MKIITFATLKGGTGKTISCFSIAGILAEQKSKVLIVDIDPQANITSNIGVDEFNENFLSIKEVFENQNFNLPSLIIKSPISELANLDIIPSSILLTSTEMKIIGLAGREFILKNYFKKNMDFLKEYDYILFDTNPSMSIINQNAFVISNAIILINDTGMNSIRGIELFMALWEDIATRLEMENNIKGIIINKFDQRTKLSREFLEYCKDNDEIKNLLFDSVIPSNIKLSESEIENKPINIYSKDSKGYKAYKKLVSEIRKRI
jgi:chromosome partitioning protein